MKKTSFIVCFLLLSGCLYQNHICGTYQATLPAADAPGIDMTLQLNPDKSFKNTLVYQETENGTFYEEGTYSLNKNILELKNKDTTTYFEIGKDKLWMLNAQKKKVTGPLSEYYIFTKTKD